MKWLKNGEPLYEQQNLIKITNLDSISLLEFSTTRVQDQANYTCELTNYLGKDLFITELIVTGMYFLFLKKWMFDPRSKREIDGFCIFSLMFFLNLFKKK